MITKHSAQLLLLVSFLIIACCLPWISTPSRGLSLGVYDLAEWVSLHPNAHLSNPPLLTPLVLRLSLVCLSITISIQTARKSGVAALLIGIIAAIMLLPPPEFFTLYREDMNYQQQFFLAVLTLVCSIIILAGRRSRFARPFLIIVALIGVIGSLGGLLQSLSLMRGFGLESQIGGGAAMTILGFALLAVTEFTLNKQGSSRLPCSRS